MNDQPNTVTVLKWIEAYGAGVFTISEVSQQTDLTRRQATTCLHGLKEGALSRHLDNVGRGTWRYSPEPADTAAAWTGQGPIRRYRWPDDRPREQEVGDSLGEGIIIAKNRSSAGWHYVVRSGGALYRVFPLWGQDALYSDSPSEQSAPPFDLTR